MTASTSTSNRDADFPLDPADQPRRRIDPADYSHRRTPVLPAERISHGRVKVLCRFCSAARKKPTYHIHGEPGADGTRHRTAPCLSAFGIATPYSWTGYDLHVVDSGFNSPESLRRLGFKGGRR